MREYQDRRHLVALGSGVYTVSDVCRILQPSMTRRKVHYWIDTGLLSEPARAGRPGLPTLLTYRQLLEVRTVQHLRDELDFSLPRVREALTWILDHLFADVWTEMTFARGVDGSLVARTVGGQMVVPGGQGVLDGTLRELNEGVATTRRAWTERTFVIPGRLHLVSNARVLAGAPTIRGSRIETALVARLLESDDYDLTAVRSIVDMYPTLSEDAVAEALDFEGLQRSA